MTRTALALLALVLFAAPAAAQNANKWGAIAFGAPDRKAGTAVDYASAGEARQAALAAVAQSPAGAAGSAVDRWRGRARSRAVAACARSGPGCEITAWACTAH